MSTYAIKADKFFLPAGPQLGGYLMVEDGVFGAWQADEPSCEIKDYTGSWIAPGMVDTHIHGFYNHSTTDNDPEGIDISSTKLARRGTTSWLPTTFTDGVEQIKDACAAIAADGYARSFDGNVDLAAGDTDIGIAADAVRIAFSDCGDLAAGDADAASSSFIAANGDSRIIPDSFYGAAGDFYPC